MKTLQIIGLCFLASCNNMHVSSIREFIPGTYTRNIDQEYSHGNDTLIISLISEQGNSYRIKRKSGYKKIRNGKEMPMEFKEEEMIGIYNPQEKVIRDTKYGKVLSFSPEEKLLICGTSEYRKIE